MFERVPGPARVLAVRQASYTCMFGLSATPPMAQLWFHLRRIA